MVEVANHHFDLLDYSSKGKLPKIKDTVSQILKDPSLGFKSISMGDYDKRTALHLAASEGHLQVVQYLIDEGFFKEILIKDRWNNTPLDDAIRHNHKQVEAFLK